MSLIDNLQKIKENIPEKVKLVAVSKTKPEKDIMELYNSGYRIFGENKVQELVQKFKDLPKDIEWHQIGHLQKNKVKYITPFVALIHAVDSLKLLSTINKEALKNNRIIDVLLQIHIAQEETKFGFSCSELNEILNSAEFSALKNIKIVGLMGMATNTNDTNQVHKEFRGLKQCFDSLKNEYFERQEEFKEISMGMSGDYPIAIEEGATIIRVGSHIFGKRDYTNR